MSSGVRSRTEPAMPCGLRLSLHSPQPTSPSSVSTRTKVQGRQPPSQWSASTRTIFMARDDATAGGPGQDPSRPGRGPAPELRGGEPPLRAAEALPRDLALLGGDAPRLGRFGDEPTQLLDRAVRRVEPEPAGQIGRDPRAAYPVQGLAQPLDQRPICPAGSGST